MCMLKEQFYCLKFIKDQMCLKIMQLEVEGAHVVQLSNDFYRFFLRQLKFRNTLTYSRTVNDFLVNLNLLATSFKLNPEYLKHFERFL